MFQMLGNFMKFLLEAPRAMIRMFSAWRQQRRLVDRATYDVEREKYRLSDTKKFFIKLGRWFLIVVFIVVVVVWFWGLFLVNDYLDLERVLGGPWPALRAYWLPILFFLVCVSVFLGRRLWRMLGPEKETGEFPDIDQAWLDAQAALAQVGINLSETPMFLVLGRPASAPDELFTATRLPFLVRQAPVRSDAPLQVYANRQGIFVTAFGTGLLGKLGEMIAAGSNSEPPPSTSLVKSLFDEAAAQTVASAPVAVAAPTAKIDPLLATPNLLAETSPAHATEGPHDESSSAVRKPILPPLKKTDDIERAKRRLTYLCHKLVKDRRPYCSLNGVLILLPFDGLEQDEDSSQLASLAEQDLEIVREVCQTRSPAYVVVSDLERAPGFASFFQHLDAERRQRLLGRDFPLLPDVRPEELPAMVTGGLQAFLQALSGVVYQLFRVDSPEEPSNKVIPVNTQLYGLLGAMQNRRRGLERVLTRLVSTESDGGLYLGGCFFAATGADVEREQAFAPAIFRLLVENQNKVAWTSEALSEERDYQRWTLLGYGAMGCFCIAMIVLGVLRWQGVG